MSNNVRFSAAVPASLAVDGEAMDHDCSGEWREFLGLQ
jgi:hypothetical protein